MTERWHDAASSPINPPGCAVTPLAAAADRLAVLTTRVRADLHTLRHPEADWMPARPGPDGRAMLAGNRDDMVESDVRRYLTV